MKLLVDSCVSLKVVRQLSEAGYDAKSVRDYGKDPGDVEVLEMATQQGRTLITLDKDFGELAVLFGAEHRGIIRLVGFMFKDQLAACLKILKSHEKDLQAGALITVDPKKVRMRKGSLGDPTEDE